MTPFREILNAGVGQKVLENLREALQNVDPFEFNRRLAESVERAREHRRAYSEHLLHWLAARRDFPGLDVGPEPDCYDPQLRSEIIREFERRT